MNWLTVLAVTLQLADGAQTCAALRRGAIEANPLLPQSCTKIMAIKAGALVAIPLVPQGKARKAYTITLSATGATGIGLSVRYWF